MIDLSAVRAPQCVVASLDGEVGHIDLERPDDAEQYEYCKQLSATHSSPVSSIQVSPIFPDVLLSVGDWTFQARFAPLRVAARGAQCRAEQLP